MRYFGNIALVLALSVCSTTKFIDIPEGFTVFYGQGQWRNPLSGNIAGGRTKIVLIAAKREPDLTRRTGMLLAGW